MSLSRSQKLYLYSDDKVIDAFQIHAGAYDVNFSYAGKPIKFNMPVLYKDGATMVTLTDKFSTVVQSVTDEKSRAQVAEMVLTGAVNDEKARAIIAEVKIQGFLDAEISRSTEFDNNLVAAIAVEQVTRQNSDTKLTNDLAYEISRAQASEVVLTSTIQTEKTRAEGAELVLRTDLAQEVTDRKSAVSDEAKLRTDADTVLDNKISTLSTLEASHFAEVKALVDAEKSRAETAEGLLSGRISFLTANTDIKALDSLSEIVNRMNATGQDIYTRLATIELALETLRNASLYTGAQQTFVPDTPPS